MYGTGKAGRGEASRYDPCYNPYDPLHWHMDRRNYPAVVYTNECYAQPYPDGMKHRCSKLAERQCKLKLLCGL